MALGAAAIVVRGRARQREAEADEKERRKNETFFFCLFSFWCFSSSFLRPTIRNKTFHLQISEDTIDTHPLTFPIVWNLLCDLFSLPSEMAMKGRRPQEGQEANEMKSDDLQKQSRAWDLVHADLSLPLFDPRSPKPLLPFSLLSSLIPLR